MPINPLFFLGIFILIPLIEIVLLIQLGSAVGVFTTIAIVIGTAIIGTTLLRQQGFGVLARAATAMQEGEAPIEPVTEGVFLIVAGAFLLTPGLITDAVGFILLVPTARRAVARWSIKKFLNAAIVNVSVFNEDGDDASQSGPRGKPGGSDQQHSSGRPPDVIDGEFERLDEKTYRPNDRDRS